MIAVSVEAWSLDPLPVPSGLTVVDVERVALAYVRGARIWLVLPGVTVEVTRTPEVVRAVRDRFDVEPAQEPAE